MAFLQKQRPALQHVPRHVQRPLGLHDVPSPGRQHVPPPACPPSSLTLPPIIHGLPVAAANIALRVPPGAPAVAVVQQAVAVAPARSPRPYPRSISRPSRM